jgi:hypothetical protein
MNSVRWSASPSTVSIGARAIDFIGLLARRLIDKNLSDRNVHINFAIESYALTTAVGKRPKIADRAVSAP